MRYFSKIFKYIFLFVLHGLFYILTALCPKKKNLWLFGCWEGKIYADNSKYLFEWINKNKKIINAVWLTGDNEVFNEIKSLGYSVEKFGTLKAYILLARASIIVETEGNNDIGGYIPGRCKIIQLWHGVAPKKMNYRREYGKVATIARNLIFDYHEKSYWMVSSEQNKAIMKEFFHMNNEHVFVTGYARNDNLLLYQGDSPVGKMLSRKYPGYKKIIYMPTHRNFGNNGINLFSNVELLSVNQYLKEHNYVMVFKPHFHELKNYLSIEEHLSNIVLAKDQKLFSDVYSYINSFDLLISDYSSIEYDFLCTKKPIVLFPYDIDTFRKSDGLFDYYESIPCGPFCYSWNEVLIACTELFSDDRWAEKREKCRLIFHPFDDGKNCERIFNAIIKINS